MKTAQREVKHCVKEAKDNYRRKVEEKLRENNMREVWDGVRTITGHNTKTRTTGGTMEMASELMPLSPHPHPHPRLCVLNTSCKQSRSCFHGNIYLRERFVNPLSQAFLAESSHCLWPKQGRCYLQQLCCITDTHMSSYSCVFFV